MYGPTRRGKILKDLSNRDQPIPAREFAKKFDVSRQAIVGDVALLRAEGYPIVATNRGYVIKQEIEEYVKKYITMDHQKEGVRLELETFVDHGVIVESVTVDHPVYGEITGQLYIQSKEDIDRFLKAEPTLLSTLTGGVHLHTIHCPDDASYIAVKEALRKQGLVYQQE